MSGAYDWARVRARIPEELKVSAVVVSYRTGPVLFDCLHALLADPDIAEVVLVDNGNPAATLERIEALKADSGGRLKVTGGGVNRGYSAGVNLGAKTASGARLLVINPDAVLRPGSAAAFEAAFEGAAEPAIVGGRIYGVDGAEQRGARRRHPTLARAFRTMIGRRGVNRMHTPPPDEPVAMEAVSGALMYFSRRGFDRLGGFDEGYFLHVEDFDICRRAEADGGSVIYTPHAAAMHYGGTSDAPSLTVERYKAAGFKRYFAKFASSRAERFAILACGPMIDLALWARAMLRGARRR
ncbi:MAG: glycosyltransferase family 2 protein [Hyphomonadaceae bacterium]